MFVIRVLAGVRLFVVVLDGVSIGVSVGGFTVGRDGRGAVVAVAAVHVAASWLG